MALSNRTKWGIALAVAVLTGFASVPLAALFLVLAVILIALGQEPKRTEEFLGRFPHGNSFLNALAELDLMPSSRDLE